MMVGVGLPLLAAVLALGVEQPAPDPVPVVNGSDAAACEFPAAAAAVRSDGSQMCTVIVAHPRVVLLAAHCLVFDPPINIVFGESVFAPEETIGIERCDLHPQYEDLDGSNLWDVGYCILVEDAPDVPIVPPLMGCEAEQLVPGANVTLAGYGMSDEAGPPGNGIKRWTVNTVEEIDEANNDLLILGVENSSVCFGDSGGPAYMQLDDGSWRVVGITSEPHPDVEGEPLVCGYGAVYDLVHLEMEWFETETGYDLTPCFEADGTWAPDEDCGAFPTSLTTPGLTWGGACMTDELSDLSATCGDPFGWTGTSSGGAESTSTTGDNGDSTSTGGPLAGSSSDEGDPPVDAGTTTTAAAGETSGGAVSEDDGGCGCRGGGPGSALPLLLRFVIRPGPRRRRAGSRSRCR